MGWDRCRRRRDNNRWDLAGVGATVGHGLEIAACSTTVGRLDDDRTRTRLLARATFDSALGPLTPRGERAITFEAVLERTLLVLQNHVAARRPPVLKVERNTKYI